MTLAIKSRTKDNKVPLKGSERTCICRYVRATYRLIKGSIYRGIVRQRDRKTEIYKKFPQDLQYKRWLYQLLVGNAIVYAFKLKEILK